MNKPHKYKWQRKGPNLARDYIEKLRWGNDIICPECNSNGHIIKRYSGVRRCVPCRRDFNVRTYTHFYRSHVRLNRWLYAIELYVVSRGLISTVEMGKRLGVTQKTAWFMILRLRQSLQFFDSDESWSTAIILMRAQCRTVENTVARFVLLMLMCPPELKRIRR